MNYNILNHKYILLLVIIVLGLKSYAQNNIYGIQSGLIISNNHLKFEPEEKGGLRNYDWMINYSINGYFETVLNTNWSLSYEPGYFRKGYLIKYNENDPTDDVSMKLHYLSVPIFINTKLNENFFLKIGPELGFLINVTSNPKSMVNLIDFYERRIEFAGNIGFGYKINSNMEIEARYNHDIIYNQKLDRVDSDGLKIGELYLYNETISCLLRFIL